MHLDAGDSRRGRASLQPFDELQRRAFLSDNQHLDAPIGQVRSETAEPEVSCFLPRGCSVEDALHKT